MDWTGRDNLLYLVLFIWDDTLAGKNLLLKEQILACKRTITFWEQIIVESSLPCLFSFIPVAGPRSADGSVSDPRAKGLGFDTQSIHILSFLLPLIQEGQLSVTGGNMCTKYWLTA